MFTKSDFAAIDRKYFTILQETCYYIELESRNTKHCWSIYSQQYTRSRPPSLVVRHKHVIADLYHYQKFHPKTIIEAQKLIKEHDLRYISNRC